jgi:uncharacterized protein
MTPQERQLVTELFDRLAALENSPRDPSAEAVVREGFRRAPNAAYALVQTVLLQDEALKAANARIQQYEQADAQGAPPPNEQRGFLDNMRDSLFGREQPRGSVPRVPQGGGQPMGAPAGASQGYRNDPWGQQPGGMQPAPQMQQPMAPPPQQAGGSSFLGTAAAAAAGMIGGSLLMSGIRSAMAGHQAGPAQSAFDQISGSGSGGDRSPWSSNSNNDLARDLGVNDVGGGSRQAFGDTGQTQRAGLFDDTRDNNNDDNDNDSSDDDYDSDSDDGDSGYDEA